MPRAKKEREFDFIVDNLKSFRRHAKKMNIVAEGLETKSSMHTAAYKHPGHNEVVVAKLGRNIAGWSYIDRWTLNDPKEPKALVINCYILPKYRGQGVGGYLAKVTILREYEKDPSINRIYAGCKIEVREQFYRKVAKELKMRVTRSPKSRGSGALVLWHPKNPEKLIVS